MAVWISVQEAEPLVLLPGAREAARLVLVDNPATAARIERVMRLGGGFESAYALELLATVHWSSTTRPNAADWLTW